MTRAKSLRLFRQLIKTCVFALTLAVSTLSGPVTNSFSSRFASSMIPIHQRSSRPRRRFVRSVASPPKPRRMNECRRDSSPSPSSSSSRRANRSIDRRRDSPSRFDRRRLRRRVTRRRHPSSPAARDRRVSFPSSWTCESPEVYYTLGVIRPTLWGEPRYSITHSRMRDKPRILSMAE